MRKFHPDRLLKTLGVLVILSIGIALPILTVVYLEPLIGFWAWIIFMILGCLPFTYAIITEYIWTEE